MKGKVAWVWWIPVHQENNSKMLRKGKQDALAWNSTRKKDSKGT